MVDILEKLNGAWNEDSKTNLMHYCDLAGQEIVRLRAALKPFAAFLDAYDKAYPNMGHADDELGWLASFGRITFGELRAAREALNIQKEPT